MDEIPAPAALDARRRRLLFRAQHRGTRETDLLVGRYIATRIHSFAEAELAALEAVLEMPDPVLADWLTGRAPIPDQEHLPLLTAMREAAQESAAPCK
jgi:antitoxin CptB